MIGIGLLRSAVIACAIVLSAGATAATPVVGIQITTTGVTIEGTAYSSGDVEPLRAKLSDIRTRVPKPDLSIDTGDGSITDAQMENSVKLLMDAGFEQDLEEHTR